jgi:hypothetical protein
VSEELLDDDGYPTDVALTRIADWPHADITGLLEYARELWTYQDRWTVEGDKLFVSTGGWSGNESIIAALKRNGMFWIMCWEQSRRGGHYIFDLSRMPKAERQAP